LLKDELLEHLATTGANTAQFVSYEPSQRQRFSKIRELAPNIVFPSVNQAAEALLRRANSVNIRTFLADKPDGNPFDYGIMRASEVETKVVNYMAQGYHVIINETIAVNDGGFSGVLLGSLMEGAPNETPRCVEKPGCMFLPRKVGFDLIKQVYNFHFHMPFNMKHRVEFSVHPHRVGYAGDFQVIWQADLYDSQSLPDVPKKVAWPNKYSLALGDKAFGLLIAALMGFPVPKTTVFGRMIPQFCFGTPVGNGEPVWVRTVPKEQTPGRFQTRRGYFDPFSIMQDDDPDNTRIAAILIQEGVPATYSGSAITDNDGNPVLEGCRDYGDLFMVGEKPPEKLPRRVQGEVGFLFDRLREVLGDVRFEWVYDGEKAWLVQLHTGKTNTLGNVIYPGDPVTWKDFWVRDGLENLRDLARDAVKNGWGISLHGDIGLTSHFGDILRKAKVPSQLNKE
jgi:hypothetical protein